MARDVLDMEEEKETYAYAIDRRNSGAMEMMDEAKIEHIPVLDGLQYLGMVAFDELEDTDPTAEVIAIQHRFIKPLVRTGDHFLQALRVRSKFYVEQVPVVNEKNEWEGVIGMTKMLDQISLLAGVSESGSMLVLEIPGQDYSPGEINRLVESNDAMIMQLNSIQDQHTGMMQVVLRINKEEKSNYLTFFNFFAKILVVLAIMNLSMSIVLSSTSLNQFKISKN